MSFDRANQDRKSTGLPPLDMAAIYIKLYLGEELSDEEIFAIRPRWLRDELEKSKLPPDDKLQVIRRVQRLKDDLERRDPYYGLGRF